MQRKTANELAFTLDYIVENCRPPGLLPETVTEAATRLREQEKELISLRAAMAAKEHLVTVTISKPTPYQTRFRAEFTITDPVRYFGEHTADAMLLERNRHDFVLHESRVLVDSAVQSWLRDLHEKTYIAMTAALRETANAPAR